MSDTGDNVRDTMDGCSSQQQVNRFEPFRSNDCATKMTFVARIDEASHVLEWKVEVSEATKALMAPHYILLAAWKHVCVCVRVCVCVISEACRLRKMCWSSRYTNSVYTGILQSVYMYTGIGTLVFSSSKQHQFPRTVWPAVLSRTRCLGLLARHS
jgi:hypothetical protein